MITILLMSFVVGVMADGESFTIIYSENGKNFGQVGHNAEAIINQNQMAVTPQFRFQPFQVLKKISKTNQYIPLGFAQLSIDNPHDIALFSPVDNQLNKQSKLSAQFPSYLSIAGQSTSQPSIVDQLPSHLPIVNQLPFHLPTVNQFPSHLPIVNQLPSHSQTVDQLPSHLPTVNQLPYHPSIFNQLPTHLPTVNQLPFHSSTVDQLPSHLPSVYDAVLSKINQPNELPLVNYPGVHQLQKVIEVHPSFRDLYPGFNELQAEQISENRRLSMESSYLILDVAQDRHAARINETKKSTHQQLELNKQQFETGQFSRNIELKSSDLSRNVETVSKHNGVSTHAQPFPGITIESLKSSSSRDREVPNEFPTFDAVP